MAKATAKKGGYIEINKERCKACELCINFCNQNNLCLSEEINARGFHPVRLIDKDNCTACGNCALMCPDMCITVFRKKST